MYNLWSPKTWYSEYHIHDPELHLYSEGDDMELNIELSQDCIEFRGDWRMKDIEIHFMNIFQIRIGTIILEKKARIIKNEAAMEMRNES